MKYLLSVLMVTFVTSVLFSAPPAEAKRLGGGASFGKSFKYSRTPAKSTPAAPQRNVAGQSANGTAAAGAGRKGMMGGMLGGLIAGGVLGALFFGGAFEGLQIMDFLIMGLLAFLGFKLFKMLRNRGTQLEGGAEPVWAGAGNQTAKEELSAKPQQYAAPQASGSGREGFSVPDIGAGLQGEPLSAKPDWFEEAAFMSEVESHFRELQRAWDNGDFSNLKEYVTPEMYMHLREQFDALEENPETHVVSLNSQLLDVLEDGDDVVAAIHFTGTISENGQQSELSEVWHVRHAKDDATSDWKLDGIQQYEQD